MMTYWVMAPMKTTFGARNTRLKSSMVNVNPMENMMIPSNNVTCGEIHEKPSGMKKLNKAKMMTQMAKVFVANWLIFSNASIRSITSIHKKDKNEKIHSY